RAVREEMRAMPTCCAAATWVRAWSVRPVRTAASTRSMTIQEPAAGLIVPGGLIRVALDVGVFVVAGPRAAMMRARQANACVTPTSAWRYPVRDLVAQGPGEVHVPAAGGDECRMAAKLSLEKAVAVGGCQVQSLLCQGLGLIPLPVVAESALSSSNPVMTMPIAPSSRSDSIMRRHRCR